MGGGEGNARPSHDSERGPESSGRPQGKGEGGARHGEGAVVIATPPIRPDFQRGRKNFKSQPSALERLLLKGVHTDPRPRAEGRGGRPPAPRAPPPSTLGPRRPPPRERPATPRSGVPGTRRLLPVQPPGGKKGVCVRPAGGADRPADSGSPPPRRRAAVTGGTGGWQDGRRGVSGQREPGRAASAGSSEERGSELTVPREPRGGQAGGRARTAPGREPRDKRRRRGRRAAAAAPIAPH